MRNNDQLILMACKFVYGYFMSTGSGIASMLHLHFCVFKEFFAHCYIISTITIQYNKVWSNYFYLIKVICLHSYMIGWLVSFNSISTLVGYLVPNPVHIWFALVFHLSSWNAWWVIDIIVPWRRSNLVST